MRTPVTKEQVLKLIAKQAFNIIHRDTGVAHPVYDITSSGDYVIADEEGMRKTVEAHPEDCTCGNNPDYYIPKETLLGLIEDSKYHDFRIDLRLLNEVLADIKADYDFSVHDYVIYKSDRHIGDSRESNIRYPTGGMLVYVTSIWFDKKTSQFMMSGYSSDGTSILQVAGECWRFKGFDISKLEQK